MSTISRVVEVIMPATVAVLAKVTGMDDFGVFTIDSKVAESTGNLWYTGGRKRGINLPGDTSTMKGIQSILETLETAFVNADGTTAVGKLGEFHISKPRQSKDGRSYGGGNPTITATASVTVCDAAGDEHAYIMWVTMTWLGAEKLFSATAKLTNQATRSAGDPLVGAMSGFDLV